MSDYEKPINTTKKALEAGVAKFLQTGDARSTTHPSGIEYTQIARHMGFNLGSAIAHIWNISNGSNGTYDLERAIWHLQDEINLRKGTK